MNNPIKATTALASLLALTSLSANALPIDSRDKPFNQYSWVTTHNSYEKINQNLKELPQQLQDGVRGFMLDIYFKPQYSKPEEQVRVCHKESVCYGTLLNQLKNEFVPFLRNNPKEVITFFFESKVNANQLQAVFDAVPELADYSFNPKNFSGKEWPTLKEMADKNNRLVILTPDTALIQDYTVGNKTISVLYDKDWIVENHWETLGTSASNIESTHNWSCPTRHPDLPLDTKTVNPATGKQWSRLFLMNQFHSWTSTTPDSAAYDNNLTYLMRRTANCGVTPNFIGVNNYKSGEVDRYTNALNNGAIYFYEATNADKKQDAVCVVPTGHGNVNLKANGCENDEAKSLTLSGVKKGTRITLFDNKDGNRNDDYMTVDVKRDIGMGERVLVPNFEFDSDNQNYRSVFVRNNGLNGKLSRITIDADQTAGPGSKVHFYEGDNASQNRVCMVPSDATNHFNLKNGNFGCRNDEIRSAKIFKATAGSVVWVGGNPDGSGDQGATHITVLRDIDFPVVIPHFGSSYQTQDVKVVNTTKNPTGKISYIRIDGKNVSITPR
jgi:hypothetical protein